jgi:hypothetical protein
VFSALDVTPDGLRRHLPCRPYVVAGSPQVVFPDKLPEFGELGQELAGRNALEELHGFRDGQGGRDREKEVEMVRLDLQGKKGPAIPAGDLLQDGPGALGDRIRRTLRRYLGIQTM